MPDRGFLRWACVVVALLFGLLWLLSAVGSGFSAPGWVGPAGLLAVAVAVALP